MAIILVGGLALSLVPAASAQQRRTTRVIIFQPAPGPFFYDPFFYGPGFYGPVYAPGQTVGFVKIDTHLKDDSIYVDGGYAGKAGKLKNFALRPGSHDIEFRDSDGRKIFQERVAVLVGKTTKIHVG